MDSLNEAVYRISELEAEVKQLKDERREAELLISNIALELLGWREYAKSGTWPEPLPTKARELRFEVERLKVFEKRWKWVINNSLFAGGRGAEAFTAVVDDIIAKESF